MKKILSTMFLMMFLSSFSFASARPMNNRDIGSFRPQQTYQQVAPRMENRRFDNHRGNKATRAVGAGLLGVAATLLVLSMD